MFKAIDSPYLVPFNRNFKYTDAPTKPPDGIKPKDELKTRLDKLTEELDSLQRVLYAQDRYALLLIFQAMDAAGKDSTIRAVMKGVDPTGCQVYSFKQPSSKEVDHDFLWRTVRCLPERGRIGIFNRSYYEEVLVVRVHPEYLERQRLPGKINQGSFWEQRYESIRDHEKHIARNGTVLLKFWLNVSKEEQAKRFLSRLEEPEKNWKFSPTDVQERAHWHDYMKAYEKALDATSRPWAPWYAIPADNKAYLQVSVAEIIVKTLKSLDLKYPEVNDQTRARFREMRRLLGGS